MKHRILIIIALFVANWTALHAQPAEGNLAPTEKSLLWEISGNGLESPSYLYGTIHMIDRKDFFLTESTKKSLSKANNVVFEINMEDMSNPMAMLPMLMKIMMNGDTTLSDLLTDEEYELVADHFANSSLPLPMAMLERVKPMFLSMLDPEQMMSMEPATDSTGMVSYELELMQLAQEQNKGMGGLETAEFQMSLFDSIPYKVQAQMLMESIKGGSDQEAQQLDLMVEMYKNQDIQAMQDIMKDDTGGIGKYEELLLLSRNRNWIPVMQKMMAESPTFFAVGAGHLGGQEGVIALLRAAGFKVEAVN